MKMFKNFKNSKKGPALSSSKGFTLIELLVVIAIIGILSSVVLASLNTARKKARDARRLEDIKQIQTALTLYSDSNNSTYPLTVSALVPAQIPAEPKDPTTGAIYSYAVLDTDGDVATCEPSYHLGATLEEANPALNSDANASAGTACTGSVADFDGAVAKVYDVKP